MAVIPARIYRRVEAALHHRGEARTKGLQRYQDAVDHATRISSGLTERVQSSTSGDRLERDVIRIAEASEALDAAERWEKVFRRLDVYFAGQDEAKAAQLLYIEHLPQNVVAKKMFVDRQTVRRWRDSYVCHAALLAAEAGLIRMEDDE